MYKLGHKFATVIKAHITYVVVLPTHNLAEHFLHGGPIYTQVLHEIFEVPATKEKNVDWFLQLKKPLKGSSLQLLPLEIRHHLINLNNMIGFNLMMNSNLQEHVKTIIIT